MMLSVIHLTILGCQEGVLEAGRFLIDLMYTKNKKNTIYFTGGGVCVLWEA